MESSILSEVNDASILRTGLPTDYAVISTSLPSHIVAGLRLRTRAALERSDFVLRRNPSVHGTGLDGQQRVDTCRSPIARHPTLRQRLSRADARVRDHRDAFSGAHHATGRPSR